MKAPAILVLLAAACAAGDWADRAEYDLALKVRAEASPKKRIELLDQWKAKYPKSDSRQARRELYLAAYQALGDNAAMLAVAKEMLADQPANPVGQYWCTLLVPGAKDNSAGTLEAGERAAQALRAGPSADLQLLAMRALGWIRWQRGDLAGAQTELTAYLQKQPKSAEISAWLGMVLAYQKQPEKQVPSLYHLARAASLSGEGALPERQQRQVGALLDRLYTSYHGDTSGLDELRTKAVGQAFPPADLVIETGAVVAARRAEEELERTNPMLAAWLKIRKRLEGPDGAQYFEETLKPAPLVRLRGTVIRCTPAKKPKECVLGLSDAAAEEVVLKVNPSFAAAPEPGTVVEFEGRAESFNPSPFTITVVAERDKVDIPAKGG